MTSSASSHAALQSLRLPQEELRFIEASLDESWCPTFERRIVENATSTSSPSSSCPTPNVPALGCCFWAFDIVMQQQFGPSPIGCILIRHSNTSSLSLPIDEGAEATLFVVEAHFTLPDTTSTDEAYAVLQGNALLTREKNDASARSTWLSFPCVRNSKAEAEEEEAPCLEPDFGGGFANAVLLVVSALQEQQRSRRLPESAVSSHAYGFKVQELHFAVFRFDHFRRPGPYLSHLQQLFANGVDAKNLEWCLRCGAATTNTTASSCSEFWTFISGHVAKDPRSPVVMMSLASIRVGNTTTTAPPARVDQPQHERHQSACQTANAAVPPPTRDMIKSIRTEYMDVDAQGRPCREKLMREVISKTCYLLRHANDTLKAKTCDDTNEQEQQQQQQQLLDMLLHGPSSPRHTESPSTVRMPRLTSSGFVGCGTMMEAVGDDVELLRLNLPHHFLPRSTLLLCGLRETGNW